MQTSSPQPLPLRLAAKPSPALWADQVVAGVCRTENRRRCTPLTPLPQALVPQPHPLRICKQPNTIAKAAMGGCCKLAEPVVGPEGLGACSDFRCGLAVSLQGRQATHLGFGLLLNRMP